MKFTKRKVGEKLEARILYVKGKLTMVDGSSIKKYLKSWAEECGIKKGTPVVVMPADQYKRLEEDAYMWRSCGGLG